MEVTTIRCGKKFAFIHSPILPLNSRYLQAIATQLMKSSSWEVICIELERRLLVNLFTYNN